MTVSVSTVPAGEGRVGSIIFTSPLSEISGVGLSNFIDLLVRRKKSNSSYLMIIGRE